jgi:hypothetical protein
MSTTVNAFPIEELKDVEPSLITKLKHAGIQSIQDLAVSLPIEIVMERGVGRDLQSLLQLEKQGQE